MLNYSLVMPGLKFDVLTMEYLLYTVYMYIISYYYGIYIHLYRYMWMDFHNYLSMLAVYTVDTVQKSTLYQLIFNKQTAFKLDFESMWSMVWLIFIRSLATEMTFENNLRSPVILDDLDAVRVWCIWQTSKHPRFCWLKWESQQSKW